MYVFIAVTSNEGPMNSSPSLNAQLFQECKKWWNFHGTFFQVLNWKAIFYLVFLKIFPPVKWMMCLGLWRNSQEMPPWGLLAILWQFAPRISHMYAKICLLSVMNRTIECIPVNVLCTGIYDSESFERWLWFWVWAQRCEAYTTPTIISLDNSSFFDEKDMIRKVRQHERVVVCMAHSLSWKGFINLQKDVLLQKNTVNTCDDIQCIIEEESINMITATVSIFNSHEWEHFLFHTFCFLAYYILQLVSLLPKASNTA